MRLHIFELELYNQALSLKNNRSSEHKGKSKKMLLELHSQRGVSKTAEYLRATTFTLLRLERMLQLHGNSDPLIFEPIQSCHHSIQLQLNR